VSIIDDSVTAALDKGIPYVTNAALTYSDGYFPVPLIKDWVVDWETPEAAQITETSFNIGVKGLMFDKAIGEEEPSVAIPDMPYKNSTLPQQYQAYVSSYSIDGFFSSWLEVGYIKGWFNSTDVPDKFHLNITTTTVNVFLPGIEKHYGAGMPVDVHFKVTSLGDFGVTQDDEEMSGVTSLTLEFWVETSESEQELAASLSLQDTDFAFTALVDNMAVMVHLTKINIDKVSVNSCSFGKLSGLTLKVEMNNFFRLFTPQINHVLQNHPI
jgi:hypothetical protein